MTGLTCRFEPVASSDCSPGWPDTYHCPFEAGEAWHCLGLLSFTTPGAVATAASLAHLVVVLDRIDMVGQQLQTASTAKMVL